MAAGEKAAGKTAGRVAQGLIGKALARAGVHDAKAVARTSEPLVARIKRAGEERVQAAREMVRRDALTRGDTRSPEQILKTKEREQASRLTPAQRGRIGQKLEDARRNEPQIRRKLLAVAGGSGMRMEGLESSVKSQDSLERKIGGKLPDKTPGTVANEQRFSLLLDETKDLVRYTMVAPGDEYVAATSRAMYEMEQQGFELVMEQKDSGLVEVDVKNYWEASTGYRGINSTWRDPTSGQRFEMQFHTPESWAAKEVTHRIYDFSRVADRLGPQFNDLQNEVFDMVPLPGGATRRGSPAWPGSGDTS